jgi:hypothetical protein
MTSEELAAGIAHTISNVEKRIMGIGASQYEITPDKQKIEIMPIHEVFDMALEELDDLLAYIAVIRIRTSRLRSLMNDKWPERL